MASLSDSNLPFSIVVIEVAGGDVLADCLTALQQFEIDCVAVIRAQDAQLQARFDWVCFEVLDKPVPLRRKRGVALANGDVVVLIEDTTIPGADLLDGLAHAFTEDNTLAASGPVAIGQNLSERYQALACTEYGRYHSKMLFGQQSPAPVFVERLPGNFISYRREPLFSIIEQCDEGLIEGVVNQRLLASGALLAMEPKLANTYCGEDQWGGRLSTRFHHGWLYAGGVSEQKGFFGRIMQFFKSVLLPVVLSFRALRYMSRIPEIKHPLKVGLWICLLEIYWSAGEAVGSVSGTPKNMEHWR